MLCTLVVPRTARAISITRGFRQFSTGRMASKKLQIGFVPEHFSTPLHFAKKHYGLTSPLIPFPSGTGHMVTALQSGEIDIAVGLTEGWVAGICKAQAAQKDAGFKIVGTYVDTPLRWAVSTGTERTDLNSIEDLNGKKVGVSRIGSGSYVMSYVLAHQRGWLDPNSSQPPFPVEVLNTFKSLRDGVNDGTADFFMWEYFTSKRYYDNGDIKHIGDQYSPWSSWMIVAANPLLYPNGHHKNQPALTEELRDVLSKINTGINHFRENIEEAVEYISTKLDYSEEDARAWVPTVEFAKDVRGADLESAKKTVFILQQAGVVEENSNVGRPEDLIALPKV